MVSGATTNSARLKLTLCHDLIPSALGTRIQKHLGLSQQKVCSDVHTVYLYMNNSAINPGFIPSWTTRDEILLLILFLASTLLHVDTLLNVSKVRFSTEGTSAQAGIQLKDEFITCRHVLYCTMPPSHPKD